MVVGAMAIDAAYSSQAVLERRGYTSIWLGIRRFANAGLAAFDGCKHLTVLRINETPVKDQGLAYFKGCNNLEILAVHGTEIGDAGLANFKGCTKPAGTHP